MAMSSVAATGKRRLLSEDRNLSKSASQDNNKPPIPTPTLLLLEQTRLMLKGKRRNRRRTWMMCRVIEAVKKNPRKTLKELGREFGVSHVTIYRYLREVGMKKSVREDEATVNRSERRTSLRRSGLRRTRAVDDESLSDQQNDPEDTADNGFNPSDKSDSEKGETTEGEKNEIQLPMHNYDDSFGNQTHYDGSDDDDLFVRCYNTICLKTPVVLRLARLLCPNVVKPSSLARHPYKKATRKNGSESEKTEALKPVSLIAELMNAAEPVIDRLYKPSTLLNWRMRRPSVENIVRKIADQKGFVFEKCDPFVKVENEETQHNNCILGNILKMDQDCQDQNGSKLSVLSADAILSSSASSPSSSSSSYSITAVSPVPTAGAIIASTATIPRPATTIQVRQTASLINNFIPINTSVSVWCGPPVSITTGSSMGPVQPTTITPPPINTSTTCFSSVTSSLFPSGYAIPLGPNTVFIPFASLPPQRPTFSRIQTFTPHLPMR